MNKQNLCVCVFQITPIYYSGALSFELLKFVVCYGKAAATLYFMEWKSEGKHTKKNLFFLFLLKIQLKNAHALHGHVSHFSSLVTLCDFAVSLCHVLCVRMHQFSYRIICDLLTVLYVDRCNSLKRNSSAKGNYISNDSITSIVVVVLICAHSWHKNKGKYIHDFMNRYKYHHFWIEHTQTHFLNINIYKVRKFFSFFLDVRMYSSYSVFLFFIQESVARTLAIRVLYTIDAI